MAATLIGDRVGQPRHLERRLGVDHAEPVGLLVGQAPRPGDHPHAERPRPRRDLPPDLPQPDDAERAAVQPARLGVLALVPACPARRSATWSGMRRSQASSSPITSSATAIEFLPGQLETKTPELDAAATSIVSMPAPARITSVRAVPALERVGVHLLAAHDEDVRVGLPGSAPGSAVGLDVGLRRRRCSPAP